MIFISKIIAKIIRFIRKIIIIDRDSYKHILYYERAIKYADRGSYRRAIYYLDRLIEKCPNVRKYLTARGAYLLELEEGEAALADFDRSLECVDRYIAFGLNLSWLKSLKKYTGEFPWYPYFGRGCALFQLRKYEEALDNINIALKYEKSSGFVYFIHSLVLANLERHTEALKSINFSIKYDDRKSHPRAIKGYLLVELEDYEAAIVSFDKALKYKFINEKDRDERIADTLSGKSQALSRLKRYTEALELCELAVQYDPNNVSVLYARGCCYALQSNVELAIEFLQRAIDLEPAYHQNLANGLDFDSIRDNKKFQELIKINSEND